MSSIWRPVRERAPARSLMVIVAHPGDEAFGFGGAIAGAAAEGAYVVVVCATRGWFDPRLADKPAAPGGKNRDLKLGQVNWRNLDTVREDELRRTVASSASASCACSTTRRASSTARTSTTLVGRIVEPIRMHRPEVILSFGPDGITGDPTTSSSRRPCEPPIERAAEPLAYERRSSRRTRSPGAPPSSTTSSCHRRRVSVLGSRAPAEGYGSDGEPTLTLELGELTPAEAGGHQPPRVADGLRRSVPRLGRRGPRRVPGNRVLPARGQHRRRPGGQWGRRAELLRPAGLVQKDSSRRALLRSSGPHRPRMEVAPSPPMANQLTDENILAALGGVKDPEIGRDLVSLGMVKQIDDRRQRRRPDRRAHHAGVPAQGDDRERHRGCADALGASLVRVDWASNVKRTLRRTRRPT